MVTSFWFITLLVINKSQYYYVSSLLQKLYLSETSSSLASLVAACPQGLTFFLCCQPRFVRRCLPAGL
uniref:Secreted protein n=1 Tax=Strongyloides papillosus TaxID=174720 RepID=A0A0N5BYN5_STREA